MTDVLDLLEDLAPKIDSARQSLAFGDAAQQARKPVERAPRQAILLALLVQCALDLEGLQDATLRQKIENAISKAESVGESFAEARTAADLEAAAADYPMVGAAVTMAVDRLTTHWSHLVARDFADLAAVGGLLGRIAGAEAIGAQLVEISAQAQALAQNNPPLERLAELAPELRRRRTETLAAMQAFTGEAEVDAFLTAVTRQEATLDMVTPTVLAWLGERQALSAFRVRS